MIRLALSDVDGTLVPFGQECVSDRMLEAIRCVRDAGMRFGVASGRDEVNLVRLFAGHTEPFQTGILCNGKKVKLDGELVQLTLLDNAALQRVADLALEFPDTFVCVFPLNAKPANRGFCIGATADQMAPWTSGVGFEGVSVREVPDAQIIDATIACNPSQELMERVLEQAAAACPEFDFAQPFPRWCDILPKGLNKGTALQVLLDALDVASDEVVFFGDAENDLDLLGAVENSVAVANATSAAAAAARWHIGASEDDAVADALEDLARAAGTGALPAFLRP